MADTLATMNSRRWNNMHIPQGMATAFADAANRIRANRPVYEQISKATGVPWWFIGVVHLRESNLDMNTNLANGQPFNKKTTIVPKGRGPFPTFQDAAIDALKNCPPYAARNKDWTPGGALAMLEQYNGLGYANQGLPSPYIWSGTDQYSKGKYIADHVYDPNAVDVQLGCAGVLRFLGVFNNNTAAAATAGAVVAGGVAAATYWDHVHQHLAAYGIVAGLVLLFVGLAIYAHNHKDELSV